MTVAKRAASAAFVLAILAAPSVARAEGDARADALFKEGRTLLDAKKYDEACPKLAESQKLDPGAGTLLALALCHEGQGKTATAKRELEEAAALGRKNNRSELAKAADKRAQALEPTLAKLVIRMPSDPSAASYDVKCDGEHLDGDQLGQPFAVDPGEHRVDVSAKGKTARNYVVRLSGAGTIEIVVDKLEDEKAAPVIAAVPKKASQPSLVLTTEPPPASPDSASSGGVQRGIGWVSLGAGVVGLGAGAYFGGRAISQNNEARRSTGDDAQQANDRARTSARSAVISVAAGTALVTLGTILLVTAPSGEPSRTASSKPKRATARVIPEAGPTQVGVGVVGTF